MGGARSPRCLGLRTPGRLGIQGRPAPLIGVGFETTRTLGAEPWVPNPNALTAEEMRAQMRRLYLDTAATGFASSLAPALTPDHLVYGSDSGVPCSTEETIEANKQALLEFDGLTRPQRAAVGRNAAALFPAAAARLDGCATAA